MNETSARRSSKTAALRRRLVRERTLWGVALGVVLVAGIGVTRRSDTTGISMKRLLVQKAHWQQCADVVLAGDSRVGMGLSPAALREQLGYGRILNYWFAGVGFSRNYLEAIEKVVDERSGRRIIVLGITPWSLTQRAIKKQDFRESQTIYAGESRYLSEWFDPVLGFTRPMPLREAGFGMFHRRGGPRNVKEVFADGWIAWHYEGEDHGELLRDAERSYDNNQASRQVRDDIVAFVRRWRGQGVEVYGFRPPTEAAMMAIENERSGFKEGEFVAAFTAAGGCWIAVDQLAYPTCDGSHLQRGSALRLSRDLGESIRAISASGRTAEVVQTASTAATPEKL
jgi:hypothetical protein